jgi:hypothetical protein
MMALNQMFDWRLLGYYNLNSVVIYQGIRRGDIQSYITLAASM